MKFSKPFDDELLWEFDGLEIPEIDFNKFESMSAVNNVMSENIYSKRTKYIKKNIERFPEYALILDQVKNLIEKIKADEGTNELYSFDSKTETKSLLYFINTWDMKGYDLEFIYDKKGFNMNYHIDNRQVKLNLFLNLQDNKNSTEFKILDQFNPNTIEHNTKLDSRYWQGPTHRGSGYLFFNTSDLWHKINVEEDRYFAMMGVLL